MCYVSFSYSPRLYLLYLMVQDHDGSHIKGLLINFIHSFWPSLLKVPEFMVEFTTPIIRVSMVNVIFGKEDTKLIMLY